MRLGRWIGAFVLASVFGVGDAQLYQAPPIGNGAASLGSSLGSRDRLRQEAYEDEQMRMLQRQALVEQIRAAQAQNGQAETLRIVQAALHNTWIRMGLDEAHATAYAKAYHFADDDQAVWLSVEGQSPQEVGTAIRQALDARNFQLADQLLLGALVQSATPSSTASVGH